ncbi:MAG: prepilin-type N-terminal cleavage/methylation domain-containing protein [Nitrosomonadales bacterium]|nr:prepilin-type N-terminal cleavage/methylation domain-containing protein [Nitrosomonadales bacterium]
MRRNQSGFTLLEVAIVMVIIGLMIGLAVKGQEFVNNSRVKSLADDFKSIQVALYGYQDRFRALPGDDRNASSHLPDAGTPIYNGNGNEIISGNWDSGSGESFNLWQHIRLAGFLQGTTDIGLDAYVPLNTSGGALGVSETAAAPIKGLKGNFIICSDNIAGKLVKQLDLTMDDGNTAVGSMRATDATMDGNGIATNDIDESGFYLTCLGV